MKWLVGRRVLFTLALLSLCLGGCAGRPKLVQTPASDSPFHFVILSDRTGGHVEGEFEKAVAEAAALRPDLVLNIGDLIEGYTDDSAEITRQWAEVDAMLKPLGVPVCFVAGNHDVSRADKTSKPGPARTAFDARQNPSNPHPSYYSFDRQSSHFVVLDSNLLMDNPAARMVQLTWLRGDLASHAQAKNVYVFYHHPLWNQPEIWPALAALLPADKTIIFHGHEHHLSYHQPDGIPTYVLGASAAQTIGKGPGDLPNVRMFAYVSVHGAQERIVMIPVGSLQRDDQIQAAMKK